MIVIARLFAALRFSTNHSTSNSFDTLIPCLAEFLKYPIIKRLQSAKIIDFSSVFEVAIVSQLYGKLCFAWMSSNHILTEGTIRFRRTPCSFVMSSVSRASHQ